MPSLINVNWPTKKLNERSIKEEKANLQGQISGKRLHIHVEVDVPSCFAKMRT